MVTCSQKVLPINEPVDAAVNSMLERQRAGGEVEASGSESEASGGELTEREIEVGPQVDAVTQMEEEERATR
eukprot:2093489-Pyramimonas_sp.AAC.1